MPFDGGLPRLAAWLGQAAFYGIVIVFLGVLANGPAIHPVKAGEAELKLVVHYSGKLLGQCRRRSSEELEKLAPNMRAPLVCPREKSPVLVRMSIDDRIVFEHEIVPSGFHRDGILALYKRFVFDAGPARLQVKIRDDLRSNEFTAILDRRIELSPGRILVVEFDDSGFKLSRSTDGVEKTG